MLNKHRLAIWLKRIPPLRWGLALGVRLLAPRNYVGAVGAIFNDSGQVLLVEHVFRPDFAWGLPGGWVERGEDPARAVQREIKEELNLTVEIKKLLLCEPQGLENDITTPAGLGLAYYGRASGPADVMLRHTEQAASAYEVLSAVWVAPTKIDWTLAAIQHKAIKLGQEEFEREQAQHY